MAVAIIPTFGKRCLSAIGGGKPRSRLAGLMQLSVETAPAWPPKEYRRHHPIWAKDSRAVDKNINDAENVHK